MNSRLLGFIVEYNRLGLSEKTISYLKLALNTRSTIVEEYVKLFKSLTMLV